jgi:hypothetical protein
MFTSRTRAGASIATIGLVAALATACGGSSSATTTGAHATPSRSAGRPFGVTSAERSKVEKCLKAAGISVPTGRPGGGSSAAPRPSFTPGANRPAGGGGGGLFGNPQTQQALKACGIAPPTGSSQSS